MDPIQNNFTHPPLSWPQDSAPPPSNCCGLCGRITKLVVAPFAFLANLVKKILSTLFHIFKTPSSSIIPSKPQPILISPPSILPNTDSLRKGINNVGNTCFANASLQMLLSHNNFTTEIQAMQKNESDTLNDLLRFVRSSIFTDPIIQNHLNETLPLFELIQGNKSINPIEKATNYCIIINNLFKLTGLLLSQATSQTLPQDLQKLTHQLEEIAKGIVKLQKQAAAFILCSLNHYINNPQYEIDCDKLMQQFFSIPGFFSALVHSNNHGDTLCKSEVMEKVLRSLSQPEIDFEWISNIAASLITNDQRIQDFQVGAQQDSSEFIYDLLDKLEISLLPFKQYRNVDANISLYFNLTNENTLELTTAPLSDEINIEELKSTIYNDCKNFTDEEWRKILNLKTEAPLPNLTNISLIITQSKLKSPPQTDPEKDIEDDSHGKTLLMLPTSNDCYLQNECRKTFNEKRTSYSIESDFGNSHYYKLSFRSKHLKNTAETPPDQFIISTNLFRFDDGSGSKNPRKLNDVFDPITIDFKQDENTTSCQYKPLAFVCHSGSSLRSGHYITYKFENNKITCYSDTDTGEVSKEDAKRFIERNAYQIIYEKMLDEKA